MEEMKLTAPVFSIQNYCIHDGPGIRVTVFVKGCPLRCLWCANPESNVSTPQLMIYKNKCVGCGKCVSACALGGITIVQEGEKAFSVTDRQKCINCGSCVDSCLLGAREIAGKDMTVEEVFRQIIQDKIFMDASNGGMTISGGEALSHPEFSRALFRACKKNGIHTAIETSSFAPRETIDQVFEFVDLGLLDIKHMNPDAHKRLTGVDNRLILENIKHIHNDLGVETIIRVPVITGLNDDEENISATARFVRNELGQNVAVHLLAYHRMGESKNESLGKAMNLSIEIPTDAYMQKLKALVESEGLTAQIGG